MSILTFLLVYAFGGLTFIPCLVLSTLFLFYKFSPKVQINEDGSVDISDEKSDHSTPGTVDFDLKASQIEEMRDSGLSTYFTGWLTVTRDYSLFPNSLPESSQKHSNSAYSSLYKLVNKGNKDSSDSKSNDSSNGKQGKSKDKSSFFCVLKHGNLFLYKDESQKNVQQVIVLANYIISFWPRNVPDASLFLKRTAICLIRKEPRRPSMDEAGAPPPNSAASLDLKYSKEKSYIDILNDSEPPKTAFYLFSENNYEREDFYFALIRAVKSTTEKGQIPKLKISKNEKAIDPTVFAETTHYKTADIISLIQTLNSSEAHLQSKWFNAVLGRLFLSVYNTPEYEAIFRKKLIKKLQRVNKPGFLTDLEVRKISIGNAPPFFTSLKLTDLSPEGRMQVEAHTSYAGNLSIQIATKMEINLGSRFKTREVNLLLAVTLQNLEGNMVFKLKPPPSNRLWYAFKEMPNMSLKIEPIVSSMQITSSVITKLIENRFREALKETLVEPFYDDIAFFDTEGEIYRGGIWDKHVRPKVAKVQETEESVTHNIMEASHLNKANTAPNLSSGSSSEWNESDNSSLINKKSATLNDISSSSTSSTASTNKLPFLAPKKTYSVAEVSEDQYLSDGVFISKNDTNDNDTNTISNIDSINKDNDEFAIQSETSSATEYESNGSVSGSVTSSTKEASSSIRHIVEEKDKESHYSKETIAVARATTQKAVSSTIKKIGKWYNTKKTSNGHLSTNHAAPEMIQSRRSPRNKENTNVSDDIVEDQTILNKSDTNTRKRRISAPKPHNFPPEILGLMEASESSPRRSPHSPIEKPISENITADSPALKDSNTLSEERDRSIHSSKSVRRKPPPSIKPEAETEASEDKEQASDDIDSKVIEPGSSISVMVLDPEFQRTLSTRSILPPPLPPREPSPVHYEHNTMPRSQSIRYPPKRAVGAPSTKETLLPSPIVAESNSREPSPPTLPPRSVKRERSKSSSTSTENDLLDDSNVKSRSSSLSSSQLLDSHSTLTPPPPVLINDDEKNIDNDL